MPGWLAAAMQSPSFTTGYAQDWVHWCSMISYQGVRIFPPAPIQELLGKAAARGRLQGDPHLSGEGGINMDTWHGKTDKWGDR